MWWWTVFACGSTVPPCEGSQALLYEDGTASGFERCADGRVHRVAAVAVLPPGTGDACTGTEPFSACDGDEACGTGQVCRNLSFYGESCGCYPTCVTDADCAAGEACLGPGAIDTPADFGACTAVACRTDADCTDALCVASSWVSGCGPGLRLSCQSAEDECAVDADCADQTCLDWGHGFQCGDDECVVR